MLLALQIENFAIIERLELTLHAGFTVLSGETGAGKSILIDALNALVGGRTSRELIRTGTDRASVQGLFRMPQDMGDTLSALGLEPPEDDQLLLQRVFQESGRNTCRINGALVSAGVLRSVGERLLDIHGQHDSQTLFRTETHLPLLDAYAGAELRKIREAYDSAYAAYCDLREQLRRVSGTERERERRIDMLRFQYDELEKAALQPGEDVALEQRSRLFSHAEGILSAFSEAYERLTGEAAGEAGAREQVQRAAQALRKVGDISDAFGAMAETMAELAERLDDMAREVMDVRDGTEFDPRERDRVEDRLAFLQGIRRKYGDTVEDCIRFRDAIGEELEQLSDTENRQTVIRERLEENETRLRELAGRLHHFRKEAAEHLGKGMARQLAELEMPKASFSAAVEMDAARGFDENGLDTVEFLFTANQGEPAKPLSRIASGGEMSRVMLAIKTMLADVDRIPTLIFDEIDAGVGGKAAQKVGEKLAAMAGTRQILCVTHHAQIASLATHHHLIGKEQAGGRTSTRIMELSGKAREEEITRLLSGAHRTETAQELARELLAHGAAQAAPKGKDVR